MKTNLFIIKISIALASLFMLSSCEFLNIVPDDLPVEEDAFKDKEAVRRYMYSCYSFIPNPRHDTKSLDLFTADEVVTSFEHETFAKFPNGNYNSREPVISYWDDLYQGIRQCYLLLDNISSVSDLGHDELVSYSAQATFLIAYYHWLLVRSYGPIIIMDRVYDINTPQADYPARTPYDECVDWIADKFDEAVTLGLPESYSRTQDYGMATVSAAKAIKARMLLYAASPLFNGGQSVIQGSDKITPFYQSFVDKDGNKLTNTTSYNAKKWQRAAQANLEAIQHAEEQGFALYTQGVDKDNQIKYPTDPIQYALRMTIIDKYSSEVIWVDTRKEGLYGLQNKSAPFGATQSWNGIAPTLTILETFYTKNGLPIDQDPEYDYANRYGYSNQENGDGITLNLNQNREPRFNAWIAFHNGYYEYNRDGVGRIKTQFRKNDNCGTKGRNTNFSPTGYLTKKGQHPLNAKGGTVNGATIEYPWPVIRLAELYLNYAEALIEMGGYENIEIAKQYIDKVRNRAGLKGLDITWAATGKTLNQEKMREIVQQERSIELFLENHRFWDVRRWLTGRKHLNTPAYGMNINGSTDEDFFKVTKVSYQREFHFPQNYLMPFPSADLDKNPKLVQNPRY